MSDQGAEHQTNKAPWIAALLIAIAFFTVNGVLAYRSAQIMAKNTDSISNALRVLNLFEELKVHLFRAESGQRGYLITADQQYLIHYNESVAKLQSLLTTLGLATTEIPHQKQRFGQLHQHVFDKLLEMANSIQYVQNDRQNAAVNLVESDRGFELSLQILALVEEMEIGERILLNENRLLADRNHDFMLSTLLIANGVGFLLALGTFYATFRYSTRINNLNHEIEQANQELENKVSERTQTLKRYAEELERSNRELEDFAFVASHDLQEPLRKIRAFGDRLHKKFGDVLGDQGRDYIARMHSASERMSRLIEDLLSFSRVTTRQREFEPVDLSDVLEEVCDNLEFAIANRNAKISVGPLPMVHGDPSQLRQVFTNLLSNSLKFTAPEVTPTIHIVAEPARAYDEATAADAQTVCIHVRDNGIGFEEQYKDRIFNLFQRLHGRDEYTGTGIGLAICRKIIERHGGSIDVQSEVGKGTEFSILLPLFHQPLEQLTEEDAA